MKKFFKSAVLMIAALAFTTMAFAANQVNVTVVSKPIPKSSTNDAAGGFSLEFDQGTILTTGDTITIDLDYGATIAKSFDLMIGANDAIINNGSIASNMNAEALGGLYGDGAAPANQNIGVNATNDAVYLTTGGLVTFAANGLTVPNGKDYTNPNAVTDNAFIPATGIVFKLTGNKGSQRVTLQVLGTAASGGTATVTGAASRATLEVTVGSMFINFLNGVAFDGNTNNDGANVVIAPLHAYSAANGGPSYRGGNTIKGSGTGKLVTTAENSLCVNLSSSDFAGSKLNGNIDSVPAVASADKLTFIPSNPQIAHIQGVGLELYTHKDMVAGAIDYPGAAQQGQAAGTCTPVSFSVGNVAGYCTSGQPVKNNLLIRQTSATAFEQATRYYVQLEVTVNGNTGDHGVYFTGAGKLMSYASQTNAIAGTSVQNTIDMDATLTPAFYNAAGTKLTSGATVDNSCTVDADSRAVRVRTTVPSDLGVVVNSTMYIQIDPAVLVYDTSVLSEGDEVGIKVTMIKEACSEEDLGIHAIGAAGCGTQSTANQLTFPYFGKASGNYVNVMVITNRNAVAGDVKLTRYQNDMDGNNVAVYTATISLKANQVATYLVDALDWTLESGSGSAGDYRSYVYANGEVSIIGTAMITNAATGESISYVVGE